MEICVLDKHSFQKGGRVDPTIRQRLCHITIIQGIILLLLFTIKAALHVYIIQYLHDRYE